MLKDVSSSIKQIGFIMIIDIVLGFIQTCDLITNAFKSMHASLRLPGCLETKKWDVIYDTY